MTTSITGNIKNKMDRHVTGHLPHLNSPTYKVPFARAVYKACDSKEKAPKTKHIRRIVLETHSVHGGVTFFRELAKRPMWKDEIAAWKGLCTIHRVLMDGHPKVLTDSTYEIRMLEDMKDTWRNSRGMAGYAPLIVEYSDFLIHKISFHAKHTVFDGNISLDNFLRKTDNRIPDNDTSFTMVTHLLDYQDAVLKLEKFIFGYTSRLTDLQVCALIPLVLESYAIYSVITYFMRQLVNRIDNMELFDFLTGRYYAQYIDLRDFYFKASNILAITRVIPVPMLPADPPQFVKTQAPAQRDRRRRRTASKKKDTNPVSPRARSHTEDLLSEPIRQPTVAPPPQPFPPQNPFATPFGIAPMGAGAKPAPAGWTTFKSEITTPGFNPNLARPVEPPKPVETPAGGSFFMSLMGQQQPPQQQQQDGEAARLRAENAELMRRMQELQNENARLIAANRALQADNAELKQKVEQLLEDREEDKRQRMLDELEQAYKMLDSSLFHLDSPTNPGNPDATSQTLLDSGRALANRIEELLAAVESGKEKDIRSAVDAVIEANKRFLADAKGCSTFLTDDPEMQKLLLEAARATGKSTAELLASLLASVGSLDDWTDVRAVREKAELIKQRLRQLAGVVDKLSEDRERKEREMGEAQEDLEALAEAELLAAARVIEEAARQLREARRAPRPVPVPEGEVDVAGAIMDAAGAIADAAARLVAAATEAQRERIAAGKLPSGERAYKRDPTWSEGLISAAKFVALSTRQLVEAANKTVTGGEVDDAALIAASKAVAAATVQLVAASRAKADNIHSKPQEQLNAASKLVKDATDHLVQAAKAAALRQEESRAEQAALDLSKLSATDYKIKQMDQATKIIRLEQELAREREQLRRMRQAEYQVAKTATANPNFEKVLRE